jgi:hypothetical protein
MANTDGQDTAVYNANASGGLPASILQPSGYAVTETVVSGTPFQVSTKRDAMLYVNITTAASLAISMGPEAAGTSVALAPAESEALGVTTLRVPAGWWVKLTGTVTNYVVTAVLL